MRPFPCHGTIHSAVEAALQIVAETPLAAENNEDVLVRAPYAALRWRFQESRLHPARRRREDIASLTELISLLV
jgi:2-methylcitrate dehydratase PrpD